MNVIVKKLACCIATQPDDDFPIISPQLNFNSEADRLKTFKKWNNRYVDKGILAKTGFYYLGVGDRVRCHFCFVCLKDWMKGDSEVGEHLRWSPNCPLLRRYNTENLTIEQSSSLVYLLDKLGIDICHRMQLDD
jgi:baculoviral IAP repeat-containing protein 7/8